MSYNFNVTLHPYSTDPLAGIVGIDTAANYGHWERRDGSEGGGLWFYTDEDTGFTLMDYDGAFELPRAVVEALRAHGVSVADTF